MDELAISNFREYLQIPSVHPDVNYDSCVSFLEKQAKSLGLPLRVYHCFPNKPIVVLTWVGTEPALPSILLNSHMDVVPVYEDRWTHNPFAADIDERGNIYARGTQDTKSVGIQHLEAARRLKQANVALRRTVHISFMPDEEIGGNEGMRAFVKTDWFKGLNVGFALDEGIALPTDECALFYGERCMWQMRFHCPGQPGHGSLLLDNTAGEKISAILDKIIQFRNQEKKKLKDDPALTISDVTSINVTQLQGGLQVNIIPAELTAVVDCRIAVTVDMEAFEVMLNQWCKEAGGGIWIEYIQKEPATPITKMDDSSPFWVAFKGAVDQLNIKLQPQICAGVTDARYVRRVGIPAFGFSPMNNTPLLLHADDEFLNKDVFLRGIEVYRQVIAAVANVD